KSRKAWKSAKVLSCKGSVSDSTSEEVLPLFSIKDWYVNQVEWVSSTLYLAQVPKRSATMGLIGSVSTSVLFPSESLSPSVPSVVVPSGKSCDLRVPLSSVEGNPVQASYMFLSGSWGSGMVPEETE
ncbi:hypothetical protein Tco_0362195, partial [Tanacetum coccineum]